MRKIRISPKLMEIIHEIPKVAFGPPKLVVSKKN
jgi:hypothetical protein